MDVLNKKRYIIDNFKYSDYARNFSAKIKKATQKLDTLPSGYGIPAFNTGDMISIQNLLAIINCII